ncbi:cytochrome P450 [Nonomuraea sp. NPDC050022]|uniref:cytochrome P450 n=1 Tax=unclassified Nonomuraea TaxID=2593643 RepID=UPI0033F89EC3
MGDDLISRLLTERVATGELSREEAAMNGMILLFAGHETTANMIGLGTLALLQNPDRPLGSATPTTPPWWPTPSRSCCVICPSPRT